MSGKACRGGRAHAWVAVTGEWVGQPRKRDQVRRQAEICTRCWIRRSHWPARHSYDLLRGHRAESLDGMTCRACPSRVAQRSGRWVHIPDRGPDDERFETRVGNRGPGCHLWGAGRNARSSGSRIGYGLFNIGAQTIYAHRYAWERIHGPIPDGLFILHHCDNSLCVRTDPDERFPDGHLFLGTPKDNVADMDRKGRRNRAPHKLTVEAVRALRAEIAAGTQKPILARKYGISVSMVYNIRNGTGWDFPEAYP